jgi:CheY-like chemotaxis protein
MSRILLVDDSPHAQRIGERILADEGFEVVTVSTGDSALIRLDDVEPDVVVADTVMPGRNGYDICHYLKLSPRHRHVRVILTAGVLDSLDEEELRRVGADGTLRKPFEASVLLAAVKPLVEAAAAARAEKGGVFSRGPLPELPNFPKADAPIVAVLDPEQVRAAVTIALDASMGNMVDEVTRRVLVALTAKRPVASEGPVANQARDAQQPIEAAALETAPATAPPKEVEAPVAPVPAAVASAPVVSTPPTPPPLPTQPVRYTETVRRVNPVRVRSGSILGLDVAPPETENSETPHDR